MFDGDGNGIFSTVILDWIQWEGPLVTNAEKNLRSGVIPPDTATHKMVAEHLNRFARRAWRRPVRQEELKGYLETYRSEREAGEKLADAYRTALQGVLTSRHFIYLVEGDPAARERLTDWELASRLSYFLWSSMPDDDLFTAAERGQASSLPTQQSLQANSLAHPQTLAAQVNRMLTDERINRFIDDFSDSGWGFTAWECFRRTKSSIPATTTGSRPACAPSRWSISAKC